MHTCILFTLSYLLYSDNQGPLSVTRTQSYGAVETTDYQKTATISNRPPVPLPRSLQSLPKFTPHHNCSPEDTLQKLREHIFNSSGMLIMKIDTITCLVNSR